MSGRLSTLPGRVWQASAGFVRLRPAAIAVAALTGIPSAGAGELGDRIAESLCHPPSAETLGLDDRDAAAYRAAERLDGQYRDIQGADARAWFRKSPAGAVCRTPADSGLTLFFCAEVTQTSTALARSRRRLCR